MPGIAGRGDANNKKLEACLQRIRELDATFTIYTDGSATGGTRNGGAAAVVTRGDPADPEVLHTLQQRGRTQTCSYEEEYEAMGMALRWVSEFANDTDTSIVICTDSQSLCNSLDSIDLKCHVLLSIIQQIHSSLTLQWVPGHSDLPGNELADQAAKEAAADTESETKPVSYSAALAAIRAAVIDPEPEHERTKKIYARRSKTTDKLIETRQDQVLLAQLRSGHHNALRHYKHRVAQDLDSLCPDCNDDDHTLEHWLIDCPAHSAWRMKTFGSPSGSLEWLATHPEEVVAHAKRTLLP